MPYLPWVSNVSPKINKMAIHVWGGVTQRYGHRISKVIKDVCELCVYDHHDTHIHHHTPCNYMYVILYTQHITFFFTKKCYPLTIKPLQQTILSGIFYLLNQKLTLKICAVWLYDISMLFCDECTLALCLYACLQYRKTIMSFLWKHNEKSVDELFVQNSVKSQVWKSMWISHKINFTITCPIQWTLVITNSLGPVKIQWNFIIMMSLGPQQLPCYIRFLIISG